MNGKCKNCKYWKKVINNKGKCYCHPPQLIDRGLDSKSWEPTRVQTEKDDWCGEFKNK